MKRNRNMRGFVVTDSFWESKRGDSQLTQHFMTLIWHVHFMIANVAVDRHPGARLDGDALRIPDQT